MRIKLRGKYYSLNMLSKADMKTETQKSCACLKDSDIPKGLCDAPNKEEKKISIRKRQSLKSEFETILHESLHACNWEWDECAVDETAHDISKLLFKFYSIERK